MIAGTLAAGCDEPKTAGIVRENNALILLTEADTQPYSYKDPATGEIVGDEIEIVREAAARLGRPLEVRLCGFDELLGNLESGKADMAASGLSITDARKETVDFSIPYALGGGMFLYRAGERMPSMIHAETLRVGIVESMTYDFYLCEHGIDPIRFHCYSDAVEALKSGRVDMVLSDSCAVILTAQTSGGTLAVSRMETIEHLAIAVRKGQPELKAALDAVIEERKAGNEG